MTYMEEAIKEAEVGTKNQDGGPCGVVIVDKEGNIIAKEHNQVIKTNNPTAHAEINAIRSACKKLGTKDLKDCIMYSTCEPCPMCLSAIIWSNIKIVYYGSTRKDAASIGFKDDDIYEHIKGNKELLKEINTQDQSCIELFKNYDGEIY